MLTTTLWTGALAFELLVLRPSRVRARGAIEALASRASEYVLSIIQVGLLTSLLANVLELEAESYAGGGSLTSFTVVRDILHSHYGAFWLVRLALLFLVQLALMFVPTTSSGRHDVRASGWTAVVPLRTAGVLGGLYLAGIAMSGHADAVMQMVATSVLLDWLHLLANTLWVGGMASIALALIPAFRVALRESRGDGNDSRLAFLVILSRYSPVALAAVTTATITGMFNAQVHLNSLDAFLNSQYGRFLLVKMALIGLLVFVSASHVLISRPRLAAILIDRRTGSLSSGFTSLTLRLSVEPLLGAGILLCVALMGQVAPAVSVFSTSAPATAVRDARGGANTRDSGQYCGSRAQGGARRVAHHKPARGRARALLRHRTRIRQSGDRRPGTHQAFHTR